jgi:geranylgeranyl diphosphate synthase type II
MDNITEFFKKIAFNKEPQNLYNPIYYTLSQGGKRLRPRLVLMSAELFGGQTETALYPAAAFEMLHNFTLIHDDIMDDAPIRRGQPTVYRKWNGNIAILSGDALATLALQTILNTPGDPTTALTLSKLLAQTSVEICEGQQKDLDFETAEHVSLEDYVNMIRYKTAVLLAGCLKAGAIVAGASTENQQLIYDFGIHLGLAFQLKDDLLDVYGDGTVFGKKIGGDIRENKKTYLYLSALQDANTEQKSQLQHYFSSTDFDDQEKFEAVKALYNQTDTRAKTERQIEAYVQMALHDLDRIQADEQKKEPFRQLVHELSQRTK